MSNTENQKSICYVDGCSSVADGVDGKCWDCSQNEIEDAVEFKTLVASGWTAERIEDRLDLEISRVDSKNAEIQNLKDQILKLGKGSRS